MISGVYSGTIKAIYDWLTLGGSQLREDCLVYYLAIYGGPIIVDIFEMMAEGQPLHWLYNLLGEELQAIIDSFVNDPMADATVTGALAAALPGLIADALGLRRKL